MDPSRRARLRARVAATLFWRGGLIAACAAVAVRWPTDGLVIAGAAVGVIAIAFGTLDIATVLGRGRTLSWWWALLLHGLLSVVFGLISLGAMALSRETMSMLFAGWLALAGVVALAVGLVARGRGTAGIVGVAVFVASAAGNLVVLTDQRVSASLLLYAGAAYAALLGITEVGLARWLRWRAAAVGLDA
jgi:uncharacterized membrane protein HdeD (DUF308 family)